MLTGVEIKDLGQLGGQHSSNKKASHGLDFFRTQFDARMLKYINGLTGEDEFPILTSGESICYDRVKGSVEETSSSQTRGSSETWDTNFNSCSSSSVGLKFLLLSQLKSLYSDSLSALDSIQPWCSCILLFYRKLGLAK